MRRLAVLFACAWLAFVAVGGQALAAEEITTFKQFYGLSREQSSEGRPVQVQGVVLCYDLEWGQLYVHDGSEVRWFNPREISTQPSSGQLVEITGTTTVAGNDNTLTNVTLTILKAGALPAAKPHLPAQLTNDLGQWVETSGHVRVVDFSRGRMQLLLYEGGQSCGVFVMGAPQTNALKRLLGARVRVRGINNTQVAGGRFERAFVFVPGMDQVTVFEPPDANQVLPRAMSIDSLLNRELGDWTNSPVRINGSVVSSEPGKTLTVKDPTGVIHAQVIQSTVARNDDRVDVCGLLKVTPTETVLSDAWFEVIHPAPLAAAAAAASSLPAGKVRRPEVLTKVSEILKLRKEESAQRWPVRLRGVVLYADPEWRNGFLQSQRGAVYFDLSQNEVHSGQWVELTGETGPGGFAPEILNTSVKVLGTTNLPVAARVDLTDLADGHLDAQWVEMEGVIRRVNLEEGHLRLRVMTPNGKFNVLIPGWHNPAAPTNLVDAFVSLQGACASEVNARQQVIGATLHVPDLERIRILESAPADPFAVATTPIASVATFDPDRLAGRRVKVSGVVTLIIPDQGFFIQDAEAGIRVQQPQMNGLQPGEVVDVLGFPALGDFSPELEEVSFRRTGSTSNAVAHEATAEDFLLLGMHDGMLVTLEARLLQNVPHSANPQLVLQDGAIIFTARLEDAGQSWKMPALESGSVVRLSGVCSIQRGEQREPKSFRLRLRSPADVTLISSPPWLTAQHILWVFGGFGGVLVFALAWVRALRRQVARQTSKLRVQIAERQQAENAVRHSAQQIKSMLECAGEGIFGLDLEGRHTFVNPMAARLLGYEADKLIGQPSHPLWHQTRKDGTPYPPEECPIYGTFREGAFHTGEEQFWRKDGSFFMAEFSSVPIREEGKPVGAVVTFSDITERKRIEKVQSCLSRLAYQLSLRSDARLAARTVADAAQELLGWDACFLRLRLPDLTSVQEVFNVDTVEGRQVEVPVAPVSVSPGPLEKQVMRDGAQIILRSGEAEATLGLIPFGDTGRRSASLLFVPLRHRNQYIGMFSIQSYRVGAYDRAALDLLQVLADQAAGALERIRAEQELENVHKQLVEASRRAGMAEVATNVLHNVGNVLNSVNISTTLIVQSVKQSRASSLARVVALLQQHAHDLGAFITQDSRGKHVPAHLAQLSEHLLAEQETTVRELALLRRNVEHINEIVAMQQNYATFGGVKEMINVADLVEDSLRLNTGAFSRHDVEVIREFEPVPPLNVEKHKVLQILVNLLRNAKHACQDSERADKRITVRVANGEGRVRISVMDNGVGIPPENLTCIFNHGFTTRKDGHGFGLHSGALAAQEMGGSLTVHSDGPGQGAAFTLELPLPNTKKLP